MAKAKLDLTNFGVGKRTTQPVTQSNTVQQQVTVKEKPKAEKMQKTFTLSLRAKRILTGKLVAMKQSSPDSVNAKWQDLFELIADIFEKEGIVPSDLDLK